MMTSGGMQCVSSSYRRALTSNNLGQESFNTPSDLETGNKLQLQSGLGPFARTLLPLRALLADDSISRFPEVDHPVCHWDFLVCREWVPVKCEYALKEQICQVFIQRQHTWSLTAGLCRLRTSKVLCAGYDQTSRKFSWPAREGGADPLFYKLPSEHYRPEQQML